MVEEITEPGRKMRRPFGAPTHDYNTARLLGRTLPDLKPKYDLVLVTGDLTTDGAKGSFETALQYIQSGPLSGGNPMRIALFGLSASAGNRLLIPGNHDRFGNRAIPGQIASRTFEEVLETPPSYPYVVGYRPHQSADTLTILFFVFDSNLPKCPKPTDIPGRISATAHGMIEPEEISKALGEARSIAQNRSVKGLNGQYLAFDPAKTIRIAILHHHPFVTIEAEKEAQDRIEGFFRHPVKTLKRAWRSHESFIVEMDNADDFLQGCLDIGIQLVLFGHQHDQYYRIVRQEGRISIDTPFGASPAAIHGFCCPSALEHTEPENGFYVFDFLDEKTVSFDFYSSKRNEKGESGLFARVAEKSRSINLSDSYETAEGIKWLKAK